VFLCVYLCGVYLCVFMWGLRFVFVCVFRCVHVHVCGYGNKVSWCVLPFYNPASPWLVQNERVSFDKSGLVPKACCRVQDPCPES